MRAPPNRPMVPNARTLLPAILFTLAACSGERADQIGATWRGTVDTLSNGTVVISNPAAGLWGESENWRLVEEVRIGAVGGDTPDSFGQIAQVTLGPGGEIVVLDGQAQEVRIFDAQGNHLRTIGREGGGPGEFTSAFGLAWDGDGRLWVADVGNARYSVFDSAGTLLTSHPRRVPGVIFPWLGGFASDGRLYDPIPRTAPDGTVQYVYLVMNDTGVVVDSLPPLEYEPSPIGRLPIPIGLLAPRLTFRLDATGSIWFGMTDRYRLYQRTFSGDTLRIVERPFEQGQLTGAMKDSLIREAMRYPTAPIDRSLVPDRQPVFQRLITDGAGGVWVQRVGVGEERGQIFDVFDSVGRFRGEVPSPIRLEWVPAAEIRGDYMVGVTTDELGAPHAVRLRIERPTQ